MAQQTDYRILIKNTPSGALTLTTVLNAPRLSAPIDVRAACQSLEFVDDTGGLPEDVAKFAAYVPIDFFALAHGTGLYNRQKSLWHAIGRVVEIRACKPVKGLFIKVNQPFTDVLWLDPKGNTLIFGSLADSGDWTINMKKQFITKSIQRAQRIHKQQGFLFGVFLGIPSEIDGETRSLLDSVTHGGGDVLARYESRLPPPMNAALNVLQVEKELNGSESVKFSLVHPNLKLEGQSDGLIATG
jgi:hypothetical protein